MTARALAEVRAPRRRTGGQRRWRQQIARRPRRGHGIDLVRARLARLVDRAGGRAGGSGLGCDGARWLVRGALILALALDDKLWFDLTKGSFIAGLLHIIHKATDGLELSLSHYSQWLYQVKHVVPALHKKKRYAKTEPKPTRT